MTEMDEFEQCIRISMKEIERSHWQPTKSKINAPTYLRDAIDKEPFLFGKITHTYTTFSDRYAIGTINGTIQRNFVTCFII